MLYLFIFFQSRNSQMLPVQNSAKEKKYHTMYHNTAIECSFSWLTLAQIDYVLPANLIGCCKIHYKRRRNTNYRV